MSAEEDYKSEDDFDLDDVPFSFDQEIEILCRMNEQQMATIDELQQKLKTTEADRDFLMDAVKSLEKRVDILQKELIEIAQSKPATCYVSCEHCREDKNAEAIATSIIAVTDMFVPPKEEPVEDVKEEAPAPALPPRKRFGWK